MSKREKLKKIRVKCIKKDEKKCLDKNVIIIKPRFASELKSKNENVRNKAAKDLHSYVSTELREVSQVYT